MGDVAGRLLFTYRLGGEAAWSEIDPAALASRAPSAPPFWIEADAGDEFGFLSGARALAAALRSRGDAVDFTVLPGGHCAIDARAAAAFVARLTR